ncbi:sialic acid-binding Ig-like lectin 10 isoform X2 [Nannospalax galili]|uniref:sialic acid-binding Ig-like lectin 10 isoform X2 n=1 Tax=Nannospalax galili TaxID=1026970 RepID=UPI00111C2973|nr:sialic acid-binding Ig-like lectin 10 isoform X2 [Nannospalax galili]
MSRLPPLLLLSLLLRGSQAQNSDYQVHMEKVVTVQEGLCVFVPCSFSSPESRWNKLFLAYGYWFETGTKTDAGSPVATNDKSKRVKLRTQERFQLVGNLEEKDCSLVIRDAQKGDSRRYFFRVERGLEKYSFMNEFLLQVTDLTQKPDVFVPKILEPGQRVTIFCAFNWAFEQCPVPSFSWTGPAVSSQETRPRTSHFSVLSFIPRPQHHDTELTCRVDFSRKGVGTQTTVRLSVAYAPRDLVISVFHDNVPESLGNTPHLEVQQGQSLRLLCSADSQPPATLNWVLEDRVLSWSSPVDSRTLGLDLPRVKAGDSGRYTCLAENKLGSLNGTLNLSVLYPPEDLRVTIWQANRTGLEILGNGSSLPVLEGQSLRLVCVSHSNPPASVSWAWVTQTLSPVQPSDPGILELPVVGREHEGHFTCAAQNPLGAQSISLSLSVHCRAFSKGAFVGMGVTTLLLALCLLVIIVKMLWKKRTQENTLRPKLSRGSTILDYINVFPGTRSLARNPKSRPHAPAGASSPDTHVPEAGKKQKDGPDLTPPAPAPVSENYQEEVHYAALNYPRLRPCQTQPPQDTYSEYAEIRFH